MTCFWVETFFFFGLAVYYVSAVLVQAAKTHYSICLCSTPAFILSAGLRSGLTYMSALFETGGSAAGAARCGAQ